MDGPINIGDLRRQHAKFLNRLVTGVDRAADALATRALNMAQNTRAITYRGPGRGRESWKKSVYKLRYGAGGSLTNDKLHMLCQESGSGKWGPKGAPYLIAARNAKALRFVWKGVLMFRRWVMHPGVKPKWIGRSAMFGRTAPFFGEDHEPNLKLIQRYLPSDSSGSGATRLAAQ